MNKKKNLKSLLSNELRRVEIFYRGNLVGTVEMNNDYCCVFEYDQAFLLEDVSISPIYLPASIGTFTAPIMPFMGNFGVFDDSLPDGWGNLILKRYLEKHGVDMLALDPLQRLMLAGTTGRGGLEYRPAVETLEDQDAVSLIELAEQVQKIYQSEDYSDDALDTVFRYSGSSGGARPKVFITIDGEEWLVKFAASIDPSDVGKQEYEYSLLARECGLEMADTKLFEGKYFGTKRFDRTLTGKVHTISAAGLLHADYRTPCLDYEALLRTMKGLSGDMREVKKVFRLMVFNVVIGNQDDHAKNFSFQLIGDEWKFSPVYDVLPSHGFRGEHTTAINGQGKPSRPDLIACGKEAGMDIDEMNEIIDNTLQICKSENMHRPDLKL